MSGGPQYGWNISFDSNAGWHGSASVEDTGAGTKKCWMLSTSGDFTAGLLTSYEEHHTDNSMLLRKDFTWTQTSAGSPYAGTLISTLNPGQAYAAATKTVQTLDICGNVTQQQAYDYPRGTTLGRTYAFTYKHSQIGGAYLLIQIPSQPCHFGNGYPAGWPGRYSVY